MSEDQIKRQLTTAPYWRAELENFDSANKTGVKVKRKVRISTRHLYMKTIVRFGKHMKKPLKELKEGDVKKYIGTIQNKYTQRYTCGTLKKFLAFVGRKDLADIISVPVISIDERIEEIDRVIPEEVKKLLMAEDNARNQALIAVLYESAGRLSEVLGIKIGDVKVDKYGVIVKLFGKTKLRNIRLVAASPYVTRWLQLHAYKENPKSPLFYSIYHGKMKVLGKTMFSKIIHEAAQKAGFKRQQLKKFHPHAFRHGRLSELGHDLTDSEMKHIGGWNDRRMISLYSHIDEDRVNNKLLMLQGLTVEEEKRVSELQAKPCPKCKTLNASTDVYCSMCGLPLTKEGLSELDRKDREVENLRREFAELKCMVTDMANQLKEAQKATTLWQKAEKMGFMGIEPEDEARK